MSASSGALKQKSIKTCPNGKTYGYHGKDNHWHEAEKSNVKSGYSAIGSPLPGDPCPKQNNNPNNNGAKDNDNKGNSANNNVNNNSNPSNLKSSDNTLNQLIIDEKIFDIKEKIYYSTDKEKVTINAIPNNEKASVIINNIDLKVGDNEIIIEVVAEDGTKKNYVLFINRRRENNGYTDNHITEKNNESIVNDDSQVEDDASLFSSVLIISLAGFGSYYLIKKIKRR